MQSWEDILRVAHSLGVESTMQRLSLRSMGVQVGRMKGFYTRVKIGTVGIIAVRPLRTCHHHDSACVDPTWIVHCRPNWRNMSARLRIGPGSFGTPKQQSHVRLLCNKSLLYKPPSHWASQKVPFLTIASGSYSNIERYGFTRCLQALEYFGTQRAPEEGASSNQRLLQAKPLKDAVVVAFLIQTSLLVGLASLVAWLALERTH
jgi:hypothetical protein